MAVNDQCINFLLTTAQHSVFQYFSGCLEKYDITPAQYGVLSCLWDIEYSTPKQIAEELCLEMSTISGVLDRMQKKGLIERAANEKDRRGIRVIVTEKGKELAEHIASAALKIQNAVSHNVDKDELSVFYSVLERIYNNIDDISNKKMSDKTN